jgi:ribosomal protein L11 methyltransferase
VNAPVPDAIGWRVVVEVDAAAAELVADELFGSGAIGIEERDEGQGQLTLLAGMPNADSATSVAARIGGRVEPIHDDGWADAWREWARPVRVDSVLVQPAWMAADAGSAAEVEHVVLIEPGRSFGSGGHETTRLALGVLLEHARSGSRVLDVGCGSGVLAVAVAVAAGASVVAIDVDQHAVDVTRANAERNGVTDAVEASTRPVESIEGSFDVVVANILAVTLRAIAADVARLVAPGGIVVLSGMLAEQVAGVDAAYAAVGLRPLGGRAHGGWAARWYATR